MRGAIPRPGGVGRAFLPAVLLATAGCSALPGAGDAGRRVLHDGFITLTAPVQVPSVAAVEAWQACSGEDGLPKICVPFCFVGYCFVEAGLCALHTIDLAASPIHVVVGNGPPRIYRIDQFPMVRESSPVSGEVGELALYDVAGVAGAAIAWWFATMYVPHLFHWFTD